MSIELDRLQARREPIARDVATRPAVGRSRVLFESTPATSDDDADAESEAGIRLSLSPAALRGAPVAPPPAEVDESEAAASGPAASRAPSTDPDDMGPAGSADERSVPAPRQRVFDAYRESAPAARGERIRLVV